MLLRVPRQAFLFSVGRSGDGRLPRAMRHPAQAALSPPSLLLLLLLVLRRSAPLKSLAELRLALRRSCTKIAVHSALFISLGSCK